MAKGSECLVLEVLSARMRSPITMDRLWKGALLLLVLLVVGCDKPANVSEEKPEKVIAPAPGAHGVP